MKMDAASLFILFSCIGLLEVDACPCAENFWPCKCSSQPYVQGDTAECSGIRNPEDLILPMRAIERSDTKLNVFTMKDTSLMYLPDNLFKNVEIYQVKFVNMNITSLSESQSSFYGLENSLRRITAERVNFPSGFRFDQFRNLKELRDINFKRCDMQSVIHHLPPLPNVEEVSITGSKISFIPSKVFRDLLSLTYLNLQDNDITAMKRSMLPNPANRLASINLRNNQLSSLPNDFFENMPSLDRVNLVKNKFKILSEKPFLDALRNRKESKLDMKENPLHCDCTLSWLRGIKTLGSFDGTCSSPEAYKRRDVRWVLYQLNRLQICGKE